MSHAGSVTVSNIPVLTVSVSSCIYFYRYQLMFLYGSTCSLVDNTKFVSNWRTFLDLMERIRPYLPSGPVEYVLKEASFIYSKVTLNMLGGERLLQDMKLSMWQYFFY